MVAETLLAAALFVACATVVWLSPRLPLWALIVALVLGIAVAAISTVSASPGYPWNNLVVLLTALSAGLLLGRMLPPRFAPMLAVMLVLSVLDIAQIALTGGLTPLAHRTPQVSVPVTYLNLGLSLPWGRFVIGILDIIIVMLAEHWRRRGATFILALLPSIIGYVLTDRNLPAASHGASAPVARRARTGNSPVWLAMPRGR